MATDYYDLLGVERTASQDELKKAYRKLARELHPDANPDDPEAEARFKEVSRAYAVLSDPDSRSRYDHFGPEGMGGGGDPFAGFGVNDIFEAFFGSSSPFGAGGGARRGRAAAPRGQDLEVVIDLEFREAVFGVERPVQVRTAVGCATCDNSGAAEGTSAETCSACQGSGQVRTVRQSILGQMVSATTCASCGGSGQTIPHPCVDCSGEGRSVEERTYEIQVPAGVDNGATLRLTGRGAVGPRGGPPGDLFAHVRVRPDDRFERQGDELIAVQRISIPQAILGADIEFETLDGPETIRVAAGTQSGTVARLRGLGVPRLQGRGRGDLHVELVVDIPTSLTDEEEAQVRAWADLRGDEVHPPGDGGILGRIRSAFQ